MNIEINGIKIAYDCAGEGTPVLLLHGWGVSRQSLKPVFDGISDCCRVYSLDLPGFGESEEPARPFTPDDFADIVEGFIGRLCLKNPIIFGHSNGGRTALALAGRGYSNIGKLVLAGCAGLKPRRKPSYYIKTFTFKLGKKALKWPVVGKLLSKSFDPSKYGSADYKAASPVMKRTMSLLLSTDLKPRLGNIRAPALLFWGENDTATPLADGKVMEKLMPDAALIVYKNSGHYAFLENLPAFLPAFRYFITT